MQSLVVGGVIGAFAGIYDAVQRSSATPQAYKPDFTFFVYCALILGGVARVWGPAIGSVLLVGMLELVDGVLRGLVDEGVIPGSIMSTAQVGQTRLVLVGVALALLVIFRPQGVFGDPREIALESR
jgi:branched-chain amino acid transport system permease protein